MTGYYERIRVLLTMILSSILLFLLQGLVVRFTCKDKLFLLVNMQKKMVPCSEGARKKVQELKMGQRLLAACLHPRKTSAGGRTYKGASAAAVFKYSEM